MALYPPAPPSDPSVNMNKRASCILVIPGIMYPLLELTRRAQSMPFLRAHQINTDECWSGQGMEHQSDGIKLDFYKVFSIGTQSQRCMLENNIKITRLEGDLFYIIIPTWFLHTPNSPTYLYVEKISL